MKLPSVSSFSLKDAMRQVAGGVSVITAGIGEERTGLTATSAVSLSVEPPTMIICVNRQASAWPVMRRYRHFCVNVLAEHQHAVADRFAGRGGAKGVARYEHAAWQPLATGALSLEGALASIDCEIEEFIDRHSHSIVVGAVRAVRVTPGRPLVYAQGGYGGFAAA
ncbi:flavin reductase family protein [Labrys monachus]|uniref:Flavin reductase (DIM6/NTAB) family NADH-FMN oxidoreductase RutF n=1 Tax=Labrys monachus TaxID=217067 RepID=A0ABU0FHV3_9HYPH|nr:flavin reductase family protein [Labrys monachus]MDQ0394193.1 flavin reductase (DIM6/NTAB) family NADH-FMN oxidoreductase RutF [Labrys monachus]